MTTHVSPLEQTLGRVEQALLAVAASVDEGDAADLTRTSEALRQATVDFSSLLQGRALAQLAGETHAPLRARIRQVASDLALQREGLIRRQALVQRTLEVLMPDVAEAANGVYGQPARFGGAGLYRGMV